MKCDVIAEGIIKATEEIKVTVPIVVRLAGSNVEKAFKMMDEYSKGEGAKRGLKIIVIPDFDKAATEVVK